MKSKFGTVYLVGAGPGDPGLITVNGLDALRAADVVVYDRLAPAELLEDARDDAELVSAAKSPGVEALTQSEINALLVERAREGQTVCRLKGGDPFVFGRGGEEALALADAGVPFVVVPGITSAIGAAAYAGIPVTHRGIASSVTFVTGSEIRTTSNSRVDWGAVAKTMGTVVVLMGATRIGEIASVLISYGRSPNEPVAAVHRGTSTNQRTVTGTLSDISRKVQDSGLTAPIALVIGEVVEPAKSNLLVRLTPVVWQTCIGDACQKPSQQACFWVERLRCNRGRVPSPTIYCSGGYETARRRPLKSEPVRMGRVCESKRRKPNFRSNREIGARCESFRRIQSRRSRTGNGSCIKGPGDRG